MDSALPPPLSARSTPRGRRFEENDQFESVLNAHVFEFPTVSEVITPGGLNVMFLPSPPVFQKTESSSSRPSTARSQPSRNNSSASTRTTTVRRCRPATASPACPPPTKSPAIQSNSIAMLAPLRDGLRDLCNAITTTTTAVTNFDESSNASVSSSAISLLEKVQTLGVEISAEKAKWIERMQVETQMRNAAEVALARSREEMSRCLAQSHDDVVLMKNRIMELEATASTAMLERGIAMAAIDAALSAQSTAPLRARARQEQGYSEGGKNRNSNQTRTISRRNSQASIASRSNSFEKMPILFPGKGMQQQENQRRGKRKVQADNNNNSEREVDDDDDYVFQVGENDEDDKYSDDFEIDPAINIKRLSPSPSSSPSSSSADSCGVGVNLPPTPSPANFQSFQSFAPRNTSVTKTPTASPSSPLDDTFTNAEASFHPQIKLLLQKLAYKDRLLSESLQREQRQEATLVSTQGALQRAKDHSSKLNLELEESREELHRQESSLILFEQAKKKMASLEILVGEQQQELARLRNARQTSGVQILEEYMKQLEDQSARLEEDKASLINSAEQTAMCHRQEIAALTVRIDALGTSKREEAALHEVEISSLRETIRTLSIDLEQIRTVAMHSEEQARQIQILTVELEESREECGSLQTQLEEAKKWKNSFAKKSVECNELHNRLFKQEKQLLSYQQAESELERARNEIQKAASCVQTIEKLLRNTETSSLLTSTKDAGDNSFYRAKLEAALTTATLKAESVSAELEVLRKIRTEADDLREQLEEEKQIALAHEEKSKSKIAERDQQIESLQNQISELEHRIESLEEVHEKNRTKRQKMIQDVRVKIEEMQLESDDALSKLKNEHHIEIQNLIASKELLACQLQDSEQAVSAAHKEIADLEKKIAEDREKIKEQESQKEAVAKIATESLTRAQIAEESVHALSLLISTELAQNASALESMAVGAARERSTISQQEAISQIETIKKALAARRALHSETQNIVDRMRDTASLKRQFAQEIEIVQNELKGK